PRRHLRRDRLSARRGSPADQPRSNGPIEGVPRWVHEEHLPPTAVRGADVFAVSGCTECHTYAGTGRTNLNAPDLTAVGSHHLGIALEISHLKCPSCANPGSPMPPYASLGNARLHQLAVFLEDSKGIR